MPVVPNKAACVEDKFLGTALPTPSPNDDTRAVAISCQFGGNLIGNQGLLLRQHHSSLQCFATEVDVLDGRLKVVVAHLEHDDLKRRVGPLHNTGILGTPAI